MHEVTVFTIVIRRFSRPALENIPKTCACVLEDNVGYVFN